MIINLMKRVSSKEMVNCSANNNRKRTREGDLEDTNVIKREKQQYGQDHSQFQQHNVDAKCDDLFPDWKVDTMVASQLVPSKNQDDQDLSWLQPNPIAFGNMPIAERMNQGGNWWRPDSASLQLQRFDSNQTSLLQQQFSPQPISSSSYQPCSFQNSGIQEESPHEQHPLDRKRSPNDFHGRMVVASSGGASSASMELQRILITQTPVVTGIEHQLSANACLDLEPEDLQDNSSFHNQKQASTSVAAAPLAPSPIMSFPEASATATTAAFADLEDNSPIALSDGALPLSLPSDQSHLSEYQCLVRAQIELFAAKQSDVNGNKQGRNRPIVVGQVGIRCRHCTAVSATRKPRGSVYFPSKLNGLYQAAQNMTINHLSASCVAIPPNVKARLMRLKEKKSYMLGGGKGYWSTGGRIRKVTEADNRLFFVGSEALGEALKRSNNEG